MESRQNKKESLAIIGMGFRVGTFDSVRSFTKALMTSKTNGEKGPPAEGRGVEAGREELLFSVTEETLADHGLSPEASRGAAVILCSAPQAEDRIFESGGEALSLAMRFGFRGPCYTLYDGELSVLKGLSLAGDILGAGMTDRALLVAASPADASASGAVCFLLKTADQALADEDRIYAAISAARRTEPERDGDGKTAEDAASDLRARIEEDLDGILTEAGVCAGEVRALDVCPAEDSGAALVEEVLRTRFSEGLDPLDFSRRDAESWVGKIPGMGVAIALVKHGLQLFFYHIFIYNPNPVLGPSWFEERDPSLWRCAGTRRRSLVVGLDGRGGLGAICLSDCIDEMKEDVPRPSEVCLIPLRFGPLAALCTRLSHLSERLRAEASLRSIFEDCRASWRKETDLPFAAVLLFDSADSLQEEIAQMLAFVSERQDETGLVYESGRGSYLTLKPFGPESKIIYMNPPGSMQHLLLFYEMLLQFPGYRNQYARFLNGKFLDDMDQLDYRFGRFGMEMCMIGLVNKVAGERLGIRPDILIGASLGEIAALFSYDSIVYDFNLEEDESVMNMLLAFRDVYNYSPERMQVMYIKGSLAELIRLAEEEPDFYILVKSSPNGAFVSGKPDAVERVIRKGGFFGAPMSSSLIIHTPLVEHFYQPIYEAALQCNNALKPDLDFQIYSTYYKKPLMNTNESLAEYAAAILTMQCDFLGLLNMMYDEGGRVFIDMSTAGTCLTWAEETFEDRDALCFSIYPPSNESQKRLFGMAAKLIANRVRFDEEMFLNAFTFPWMEKKNFAPAPARKADVVAWAEANTPSFPVQGEGLGMGAGMGGGLTGLVQGSLARGLRAYELFLENELLLLQHITKSDAPVQGPGELAAFSSDRAALSFKNRNAVAEKSVSKTGVSVSDPGDEGGVSGSAVRAKDKAFGSAVQAKEGASGSAVQAKEGASGSAAPLTDTIPRSPSPAADIIAQSPAPAAENLPRPVRPPRNIIWNREQVVEITGGKPSRVLGPRYEAIDQLKRRARMPLPPFLFVENVTAIDATFGEFKPSSIEFEYYIGDDCIMLISESMISYVLITESSHIAVLLLAWIGIDMAYEEEVSYRILNTRETFHSDLPVRGNTLQARLEFKSFQQSGSTMLVDSSFVCYNEGQLIMSMDLTGGFFTGKDLSRSKGILPPRVVAPVEQRKHPPYFAPLPEKRMDAEAFFNGEYGPVIFPSKRSTKPERMYFHPKIRVLDRILSLELEGGRFGLGCITAEMDLDEDHWAFAIHFKNDPVFPGSLIAEAGNQIQLLYSINAGFLKPDARYHLGCKRDLAIKSIFRGQVRPVKSVIRFEQHFKEISRSEDGVVYVVSDCDAYWQGIHVVRTENISLSMERM